MEMIRLSLRYIYHIDDKIFQKYLERARTNGSLFDLVYPTDIMDLIDDEWLLK